MERNNICQCRITAHTTVEPIRERQPREREIDVVSNDTSVELTCYCRQSDMIISKLRLLPCIYQSKLRKLILLVMGMWVTR
jgi:hypothetical protein